MAASSSSISSVFLVGFVGLDVKGAVGFEDAAADLLEGVEALLVQDGE